MQEWNWKNLETVVVTRHPALVEYAREIGLVGDDVEVIAHATADDVRGKHVIGVLPLSLAAEAAKITEIPLRLAPEDRGQELPLGRLREIAGEPKQFIVAPFSGATELWDWCISLCRDTGWAIPDFRDVLKNG